MANYVCMYEIEIVESLRSGFTWDRKYRRRPALPVIFFKLFISEKKNFLFLKKKNFFFTKKDLETPYSGCPLALSRFLAKTLRVNKIAMKSFSKNLSFGIDFKL